MNVKFECGEKKDSSGAVLKSVVSVDAWWWREGR